MAKAEDSAIRPFHVEMTEEALADLRRRLAAARWPDRETVADRSQGWALRRVGTAGAVHERAARGVPLTPLVTEGIGRPGIADRAFKESQQGEPPNG